MKTRIILLPILLLCCFNFTSCEAKEDGDINEWVGTYHWSTNDITYYHYVFGEKTQYDHKDYKKETINMVINSDKTWKFPEEKDPKLGKTGPIKCYKDHINLLEMNIDYNVKEDYQFKWKTETGGQFLDYTEDTSVGRHGDHYDFTIRRVRFKLI